MQKLAFNLLYDSFENSFPSQVFARVLFRATDVTWLMQYLDYVQWPAMAITLVSAWLVASQTRFRRNIGFSLFLVSNALWITWGTYAHAYGLVTLQLCLAGLNVRGVFKNNPRQLRDNASENTAGSVQAPSAL
jgi:hypothetical protein